MQCELETSADQDRTWIMQGVAALAWLIIMVGCFAAITAYKSTAGAAATVPAAWPSDIPLARPANQAMLLMFLHPRCPCSRASLSQLHELRSAQQSGALRIIALRPENAEQAWMEGDIIQQARQIPSAELIWDDGGRLAARFGARTSGHVLIYNEHGLLTFSGGITSLRGHDGWNTHAAAAAAQWRGDSGSARETPVFGCPLIETTLPGRSPCCEPHR